MHPTAEHRWKETTRKHNMERIKPLLERFDDLHSDDIERFEALIWVRAHASRS